MEVAMPVIASFGVSRRFLLGTAAAAGLVAATGVRAPGTIKPGPKSALIVVDVQNCFIDGGALPVKGGAQVVPVINKLAASFENIVVTQDWHTPGHASFASAHSGKKPFETTSMRPTARRSCGPITACKAPMTRPCTRT
jgi:nicotinamidase/pyrazinamidase